MNISNDNKKMLIPLFLGRIDDWEDYVIDLDRISHLLITGFAGCGKSTLIHNILLNLLIHRDASLIRFLLYDYKGVEFKIYNSCPQMLIPAVTDRDKLTALLGWCAEETKYRLKLLSKHFCRTLNEYNDKATNCRKQFQSHLILVIDGYEGNHKETNDFLEYILVNGRTTGMHVILSMLNNQHLKKFVNMFPAIVCFHSLSYPRCIEIPKLIYSSLSVGEFCFKNMMDSSVIKIRTPDIDFDVLHTNIRKHIAEIQENGADSQ